jgi:hypothetical protein
MLPQNQERKLRRGGLTGGVGADAFAAGVIGVSAMSCSLVERRDRAPPPGCARDAC